MWKIKRAPPPCKKAPFPLNVHCRFQETCCPMEETSLGLPSFFQVAPCCICSNLHLPVVLVTNVKHCLMTLLMHCSAAIVLHCNSFESECKPSYCNPHPCMGWIKSHWSSIWWWHYCAVRKKDLVLFPWIVVRHSMNPLSVHCVILLYQLQLHFSCSMALHCF